jgi:ParB family chromosome partitioning protein
MSNKKRNINLTGALGMLIKKGEIHKVDSVSDDLDRKSNTNNSKQDNFKSQENIFFRTKSGIEFKSNDLIYIDTNECEPWKYANRRQKDLGKEKLDELIESIRINQQLQPGLIRKHPKPEKSGKKYEILFGRRRHLACSKLKIPFLAIYKDIPSNKDAILLQDAENRFREDVGNYSNAVLYKNLLNDGVFKSERELAKKLKISHNALNNLLSLAKIPTEIMDYIEHPNNLSKSMAIQMLKIISENGNNGFKKLKEIAPNIGKGKPISSPTKLIQAIESKNEINGKRKKPPIVSKKYICSKGNKLFSFKYDRRGLPTIVFDKKVSQNLNIEYICGLLKNIIENKADCSDIRTK